MTTAYLNGNFIPLEQARVSALDRGFTFADGVYEVIPVFSGAPFRLDEHLQRLHNSLEAIALPLDYDREKWRLLTDQLLQLNQVATDSSIYIQVTRGVAERNHCYGPDLTPTVFMYCKPLPHTDVSGGVSATLHEDIRWQYCHIKAVALLANVMMKQYAYDQDGSIETIMHRDGYVTEGAASNVFVVSAGEVRTPPRSNRLLPGITRDLVVELVGASRYPCREAPVSKAQLLQADEVWLTSSSLGIAPVVRLAGQPVGDGQPGPVWRELDRLYQAFKQAPQLARNGVQACRTSKAHLSGTSE